MRVIFAKARKAHQTRSELQGSLEEQEVESRHIQPLLSEVFRDVAHAVRVCTLADAALKEMKAEAMLHKSATPASAEEVFAKMCEDRKGGHHLSTTSAADTAEAIVTAIAERDC
jgi:hypothetical protein